MCAAKKKGPWLLVALAGLLCLAACGEVSTALPPAPQPDDASLCRPVYPDKPPQIEFDLPAEGLNLGTLKQGVRLEREVVFRNTGSGPLCVSGITSGCGCLKATLTGVTRRFEPGDAGAIHLRIDTTGREGHVGKRVTVTSNDLMNPRLSFKVDIDIIAGLMLNPRYVDFGNQPPNTSVTREIFLRSPPDEPEWEVLSVEGGRRVFGSEPVDYTFDVTPVEDPKFRKVKVAITHPGSARRSSPT